MFKPMLAKEAPADMTKLSYPLIVQPKLDGIRCTIVGGKALSRTLKDIPNKEIREYLSRPEFEGLDGEIVVGNPSNPNVMQATSSFVMAPNKTGADWRFYAFDICNAGDAPFYAGEFETEHPSGPEVDEARAALIHTRIDSLWPDAAGRVVPVPYFLARDKAGVAIEEAKWLANGYEGVILRDPSAPYKFGRSGKKGPLLKLKQFIDFEAKIVGFTEKIHNANEAKTNELGRTERSTAKTGLVGTGTLGAFVCEAINGPHEGQRFQVGTGFNQEQREQLWAEREDLPGKIIKVKSFPVGVVDAPRFPVFLDFRDTDVDG